MNEARPGLGQQQQQQLQQQVGGGRVAPAAGGAAAGAPQAVRPVAATAVAPTAVAAKPVAAKPVEEELESIALEEVDETPAAAPAAHPAGASSAFPTAQGGSKIHAFSVGSTMYGQENFKRVPHVNKTGACRVRSFHGRLSDSGLD